MGGQYERIDRWKYERRGYSSIKRKEKKGAHRQYIRRALLFIYMPIFIFLRREVLCARNWIFLCVFINIPLDGNSLYFQKIGVAGFLGRKRIFSSSSSRDMCLYRNFFNIRTVSPRTTYRRCYLRRMRATSSKQPCYFVLFFSLFASGEGNDLLCARMS